MSDNQLVDASFPIVIGNDTLFCSMLTDRDAGDLENWAQADFIRKATLAAKEFDTELRKEIIAVALKEAMDITYGDEVCHSVVWSREGIAVIGWVMLRKRHPKLTLEKFRAAYFSDEINHREQVLIAYQKLHYIKEASGGASTGNTKSE